MQLENLYTSLLTFESRLSQAKEPKSKFKVFHKTSYKVKTK